VRHVAEVGEMRDAHRILVQLGNLGIDARIISKIYREEIGCELCLPEFRIRISGGL
jgi:hypothetical protein